jgi:hypothetical protein
MSRQELIDELDRAYGEFMAAVDDLEERSFENKWLDGRWGVREIVAHITGWHGKLASGLERMARGERPSPEGEDWNDTQPYNETFAQHAKGKVKEEVLSELASAVEAFKSAAQRAPDETFEEGRTGYRMFHGAGIDHFREHLRTVQEWRQRHGPVEAPAR